MILTHPKIFYSILAFIVLVNILLIFDINFLYIRPILGFIFLITVPGLLLMLIFRIRSVGFWEYLVYTIGLSVAFIMFAGLLVNWDLPFLGITDKPLALAPILISFDILLLIMWVYAILRNADIKPLEIKPIKLDTRNKIFFIIPMLFPVLSILGAFLLNNHGPNILTMIMLGGIALYVLFLVLHRDKLNENVFPWAILLISISLLLSGWLRSWLVSGVDINLEYGIFQLTKEKSIWSLSNFHNAYNAMLSVNILPTILSLFTKVNGSYAIKIFFPLTFSFVPLIVYLIARKYFKVVIGFLASFFFMSQQTFFTWTAIPIRQEIAFLFFGLMLLVLFSKSIPSTMKKTLFIIFGLSMIVSHYSTSYIALAIFLLTYILVFFYKAFEKRKIKKGKISAKDKAKFELTLILVLLLLIFSFLWYMQVTDTGSGLINFTKNSFNNMDNLFSKDVQSNGNTILDQFNLFSKPIDQNLQLDKYTKEIENTSSYGDYSKETYSSYHPRVISSKIPNSKIDYNSIRAINFIGDLLKKLMKLFIIIGVFALTLYKFKNKKDKIESMFITIGCFLFFVFLLFLPFISISYDVLRMYQQVLVILAVPAIFGSLLIFKFFKYKYRILVITLLFLLYFLFLCGFINQATGGVESTMRINNFGREYDAYFSHAGEIYSGKWLETNNNYHNTVNLDDKAESKVYLSAINQKLKRDILPPTITNDNYVYSTYANSKNQIAFKVFTGNSLLFNFPSDFLNENKNKVYANGGSEIFK